MEDITKTEVGTGDWGLAGIDVYVWRNVDLGTLDLESNDFKWALIGHSGRNMEDIGAEGDLNS